jgi:hypothetical protein
MAKRMFLTEEGGMSIVTVSLFTTWMTLLLMDVKLLGLVHLLLLAALFLLFRNGAARDASRVARSRRSPRADAPWSVASDGMTRVLEAARDIPSPRDFTTRAGTPTATCPAGSDFTTTLPAPTIVPSPTVTPLSTTQRAPNHTSRPIRDGRTHLRLLHDRDAGCGAVVVVLHVAAVTERGLVAHGDAVVRVELHVREQCDATTDRDAAVARTVVMRPQRDAAMQPRSRADRDASRIAEDAHGTGEVHTALEPHAVGAQPCSIQEAEHAHPRELRDDAERVAHAALVAQTREETVRAAVHTTSARGRNRAGTTLR